MDDILGISWSAQYYLDILSQGSQHMFEAFANITNATRQEYDISRTELFGGNVEFRSPIIPRFRRRSTSCNRSRSRSRSLCSVDEDEDDTDCCDIMPIIQAQQELAGNNS
jgi:hypothetical protein